MNEKPVKVDIGFDEALRRIAGTPKGLVMQKKETQRKKTVKQKTAPPQKKGRG